jgi:hypothetical protein
MEKNRIRMNKMARGKKQRKNCCLLNVPVELLALLALEEIPMSIFPPTNANTSNTSVEGRLISYSCACAFALVLRCLWLPVAPLLLKIARVHA